MGALEVDEPEEGEEGECGLGQSTLSTSVGNDDVILNWELDVVMVVATTRTTMLRMMPMVFRTRARTLAPRLGTQLRPSSRVVAGAMAMAMVPTGAAVTGLV